MKILVTGGSGYIGSCLVPLLLNEGHEVTVLDKLMFGSDGMISYFHEKKFFFIKGDITNEETVKESVKNKDLIIHLAAYVGYPLCKKFPKEANEVNVYGSQIIDKCRGSTPLLFGSTGSNYGVVTDNICTEDTPLNPISLYGETKTSAENLFRKSGNSICYRFATAFGMSPRMRLDLMVNDFCYKAAIDKNLIVYEASFKRIFIHVRDIAKSFIFAINNYEKMVNEVYNVGSDNMNYTKKEICEMIKSKIEYYLHFAEFASDEDKRNYEVDYSKIKNVGYKTSITVDEGVDELIKYMTAFNTPNPYANV